MDFKAEREKRGWTLQQVAEMVQYKPATINGMEIYGEGSDRLRERLEELYGKQKDAAVLREGEDLRGEVELWKRRAKTAEGSLAKLKDGMRSLLAIGETGVRPIGQRPPSSKTAAELTEHERLWDAAEDKGRDS